MTVLSPQLSVRVSILIQCCGLALVFVSPCGAEQPARWEFGVRGGPSVNDKAESFSLLEAFLDYRLGSQWTLGDDFKIGSRFSASLGQIRGGNDEGVMATLGLALVLGDARDLQLRGGLALTGLSRERFGREDLGLRFQFTSSVELGYLVDLRLQLHLRFQHTSNASFSDENPGVNMLMAGLRYSFAS